jgi:hypothetical protein
VNTSPLDVVPLWGLFICANIVLAAAMEGGYRLGGWRHVHAVEEHENPVGAMVASILGLLALLLGFTFNLAATRFDIRRDTVLAESNAIGTAFLRAKLLPEPQRTTVSDLLKEYVDVRLQAVQHGKITQGVARSEEIHELLWAQAVTVAAANPNPITSLFIQSLNDVIDLHSKRIMMGLRNRIPIVMWIGLSALAVLGMFSVGYQAGLSATRRSPAMLGLVLAFVCVLYLIADLDRVQEGLFQVSQQSMLDLQRSIKTTSR